MYTYIYNSNGFNEVINPADVGLNLSVEEESEWEKIEVESEIIAEYWFFDGICRIKLNPNLGYNIDEKSLLSELERIEEEIW